MRVLDLPTRTRPRRPHRGGHPAPAMTVGSGPPAEDAALARTSRLVTATSGAPSAYARAFAVPTPTRNPVKSPGPTSTTTASTPSELHVSRLATRPDRRSDRLGVTPAPAERHLREGPDSSARATPAASVADSIARTSTRHRVPLRPRPPGRRQRMPGRRFRPRARCRRSVTTRSAITLTVFDPDLEHVVPEYRCSGVSPLDRGHRAVVDELEETRGPLPLSDARACTGRRGAAVRTCVVAGALEHAHERERRARHRIRHSEARSESLDECCLARSEIPLDRAARLRAREARELPTEIRR